MKLFIAIFILIGCSIDPEPILPEEKDCKCGEVSEVLTIYNPQTQMSEHRYKLFNSCTGNVTHVSEYNESIKDNGELICLKYEW